MIYNTRNHEMILEKKKVDITKNEHKLIIALSSNYPETYRDISKYMYNYDGDSRTIRNEITSTISRLRKKIPEIEIINIRNYGLRLINKINFM